MQVKVGEHKVSVAEKYAVLNVLGSHQLSPGPKVKEFESRFSLKHGAPYGVMVNSGTDALRVALLAMKEYYGWKDGNRVIVPAITFVATVNTVLQVGLKPYFCDVSMYDANLNPENVERHLGVTSTALDIAREGVRAIIPVHLFGKPCDMKGMLRVAKKLGLKILEDSCECMGVSTLQGDIACYSTYVCHIMSTGVGGIAITKNKKLEQLMRSYANHGRSIEHIPGYSKNAKKRFVFDRIGYSSRPTEFEAALGLEQLKHLREYVQTRKKIANALIEGLDGLDGRLILPIDETFDASAWMMFPIVIQPWEKFTKWDLCEHLERDGIETREMLPLINQPCYKDLQIKTDNFPQAKAINDRGFYIGCHPGMTQEDVDHVVGSFKRFFSGFALKK